MADLVIAVMPLWGMAQAVDDDHARAVARAQLEDKSAAVDPLAGSGGLRSDAQ